MRAAIRAPSFLAIALGACIVPGPGDARSNASQPERRVVWDGDVYADEFSLGYARGAPPPRRAQHWVHCQSEGCVSTFQVGSNGREGSHGLEFHAETSGWAGFGFAWAGWNRRFAPMDVTPFQSLSFWLRVVSKSGELAMPDVALRSPDQGARAGSVSLASYVVDGALADGAWHRAVVPLSALAASEPALNMRRVWDIDFGCNGPARVFDMYVDEIAFEGRAK